MGRLNNYFKLIKDSRFVLKFIIIGIIGSICYSLIYSILPFLYPYVDSVGMNVIMGCFYIICAYTLMNIVFVGLSKLNVAVIGKNKKRLFVNFFVTHISIYLILVIIQNIALNNSLFYLANALGMCFFILYLPIQIFIFGCTYLQKSLKDIVSHIGSFLIHNYMGLFYGGVLVLLIFASGSYLVDDMVSMKVSSLPYLIMFEMNPFIYVQVAYANSSIMQTIVVGFWACICMIAQLLYLMWMGYLVTKHIEKRGK